MSLLSDYQQNKTKIYQNVLSNDLKDYFIGINQNKIATNQCSYLLESNFSLINRL